MVTIGLKKNGISWSSLRINFYIDFGTREGYVTPGYGPELSEDRAGETPLGTQGYNGPGVIPYTACPLWHLRSAVDFSTGTPRAVKGDIHRLALLHSTGVIVGGEIAFGRVTTT